MLKRKNIIKKEKSTKKRVLNITNWKEIKNKQNNPKESKEIIMTKKKKKLSKEMKEF
jgi:hypothetical protein